MDDVLIAALSGAGIGLGLTLLIAGWTHRPPPSPTTGPGVGRGGRVVALARGRAPVHVAATIAAAAVAGLATGWPVGALVTGVAVWALPRMLTGSERARAQRIARLDALAAWTESLTAILSAAAGLEQAIIATATTAPTPIRAPLEALGAALREGVPARLALGAFSDDLDDPVADTVVATLLLAATHGGARLSEPLAVLAATTRQDVTARRQVETSRARISTDTRLIIAIAATVITALVAFNRGFLHPYDSPSGQIALAVLALMAATAIRWLERLGRPQEPPRIITMTPTPTTEPPGELGADQPSSLRPGAGARVVTG